MSASAPSRNAACPCGSGRRYKDCHGALVTSSVPSRAAAGGALAPETSADRARIEQALQQARLALAADNVSLAQEQWQQALAIDPGDPEANFHVGNVHRENGDAAAAITCYERALERAPANASVRNNLGLALEAAGERDRAQDQYRRVLASNPDDPDALGNAANAAFDAQRYAAAETAFARLFAVRRDLPVPVLVRRAITLQKLGRLADAEQAFADALQRWPDDAQLLTNLGSVRIEQSHFDDADTALTRGIELDPRNNYALSMLAHARAYGCAWRDFDQLVDTIARRLEDDGASTAIGWAFAPLPLLALPLDARALRRAAQDWGSRFAVAYAPPLQTREHSGRLRLGFVSSDFRRHPVGTLIPELLERLDRSRFHVVAYGLLPPDEGPSGARIAAAVDAFRDLSRLDPSPAVELIRNDRIDIAFDLNGYTSNSRPEIFASRCASVQVNTLGYSATMGTPWYEGMLIDTFCAHGAGRDDFSEQLLCMPNCYYPSDTTRTFDPAEVTRSDYGLAEGAFAFFSQAGPYKVLPNIFDAWMRLLKAVPGSLLWLRDLNATAQANLRKRAVAMGIEAARLVFSPVEHGSRYLARYTLADLYLDTYPFGSHTTVNDALFAGLPALTWAGSTLPSRVSASQVHAVGLEELVVDSLPAYEALALSLARDAPRLAELRTRLARNRATYPLFDMRRYARDFGDRVEEFCRMHLASAKPHPSPRSDRA